MKQYEYRLVIMEFDGSAREGQINGRATRGLQPNERIIETFSKPEQYQKTGNWYLSVLVEKQVTCFPVGDMDPDELTSILKGELK